MDTLPTWVECKEAIKVGEATPLHKFIYENEPVNGTMFRNGLLAALNFIRERSE